MNTYLNCTDLLSRSAARGEMEASAGGGGGGVGCAYQRSAQTVAALVIFSSESLEVSQNKLASHRGVKVPSKKVEVSPPPV